jgi:general secretion pathway protein B
VLAPSPVAKASKVALAPKATPTTPAVAAASAQKVEQPAIPLLNDLAEDLRRQLPKLTITGAVYSKDPTQRLLLINNLVLTQGSTVAPDLTLEDIQPHQSVFEFRGTRFRVVH